MLLASATDFAITLSSRNGTLRVVERTSRFGDAFWSVEDDRGVIEVHATLAEAEERTAR
jgi:hypothetical protein